MKLVIFGATGSIGSKLVQQALDDGHHVTAFARNPAALKVEHPDLTLIAGNVLDPIATRDAVAGHGAVLIALGSGRKGTVRSEGTQNIANAMQHHNVQRLVGQTTLGCGGSRQNLNFFWKHIMFGLLLKEAFEDHEQQEQFIKESSLAWTIVRPAAFTNGPVTQGYRHGFAEDDRTLTLKVSRRDVAAFMLAQVEDRTYLRKTPGLSY